MHIIHPHPRLALKCASDRYDSRRVRQAVAEHCGTRLDPALVEDVQLVASELVTNAYEHGRRGVITVDIVVEENSAVLTVTSSGNSRAIPHPVDWTMPESPSQSGRGLALTRMISSCVELHTAVDCSTGDWVSVTAHVSASETGESNGSNDSNDSVTAA